MSATSSPEMLKAHAVISRSWLLAQIEKGKDTVRNRIISYESAFYAVMMKSSGGTTGKIIPILMYVLMIIASGTRELRGLHTCC